jgi:hypothetical protein
LKVYPFSWLLQVYAFGMLHQDQKITGFFTHVDSLVVSLVVVNLSIYVVELSLGIHPSFRIHSSL